MLITVLFFHETAATEISTLSLHDALPIYNPWHYKFSWNPRNVVLAGQGTAQFLEDGKLKYIPYRRLFRQYRLVDIPDLRSEEHTSELQSPVHLVCRLLLEKKKKQSTRNLT